MSWARLPTELQLLVLENLRTSKCRQYEDPEIRRRRRLFSGQGTRQAMYATVCRQWNAFFESANFGKLILHQNDIDKFGQVMGGRPWASLVCWIWLRLELPTYDCTKCSEPESVEEDKVNKFIFTDAIWSLLRILSTFENTHPGTILEISAHSPSLTQHYAQELGFMINDTMWHTKGATYSSPFLNDNRHGIVLGERNLRHGAKLRVLGHPQGLRFDLRSPIARKMQRKLPRVSVIKGLVIRLQCYRHFSVSKALDPIITHLTQLRDLSYECWKGITTDKITGRHIRDEEHEILFLKTFKYRRSLRKVSIFEGSSRLHCQRSRDGLTGHRSTHALGNALSKTSRQFEEIYANDIVDASHFFHLFWPHIPGHRRNRVEWRNLRQLCLFSCHLQPGYHDQLIQVAALAAEKMPKLEIMELWNSEKRWQCLFLYTFHDGIYTIELKSSWAGGLDEETIQAWREVVKKRQGRGCDIQVKGLGQRFIFSKGQKMACELSLVDGLLQKTTQKQILAQDGFTGTRDGRWQ